MTITIKDVAKKAGVSISTVSRVVNKTQKVKEEYQILVEAAIQELGYQPNDIARSLVTKKSKLIAVLVGDIGRPYLAEILRGIEEVGKMYGYDILLFNTFFNLDEEKKYLKWVKSKQVDGVIIASDHYVQKNLDFMQSEAFPVRFISRTDYHKNFSNVILPVAKAFQEGLDFLFQNGHEDITYVGMDEGQGHYYENLKFDIYRSYMKQKGKKETHIFVPALDYFCAYDILKEQLPLKNKTLLATNDEFAIAALSALQDSGYHVPEDYQIMGFGNITVSQQVRPQLSTITYSFYDMGALTMASLIKEMTNETFCFQSSLLSYQLIVRDTIKIRRF